MKKMYLALIVGAMGLASCTEQPDPNKLHLTGSLENMGDTLIAQVMSNEGKTISTDTILVKNREIDAQIALDKVAQIYLSKPSAYLMAIYLPISLSVALSSSLIYWPWPKIFFSSDGVI